MHERPHELHLLNAVSHYSLGVDYCQRPFFIYQPYFDMATAFEDVPVDLEQYHTDYPVPDQSVKFRLRKRFIDHYADQQPNWGFGGMGKVVYLTRYSRPVPDEDRNEFWFETVQRVVEGTFSLLKRHARKNGLPWNERRMNLKAQDMYRDIFEFLWTPPGRGLWAMGTSLTEEKGVYMSLFNCAFVSTAEKRGDNTLPYAYMMDASMLGVGVGFDVHEGSRRILGPARFPELETYDYVIPDTREGWVNSLRLLMHAYMKGAPLPSFDYSEIREKGKPIKGFGGVSSGAEPLKMLHHHVEGILSNRVGERLTERDVTDIMNRIGQCVIAGNVRRTAQIALGSANSDEFLDLKNYEKNPERAPYGWASNNSVKASIGMDYDRVAERSRINGEPGYVWLNNFRRFGRMGEVMPDYGVKGLNPCGEIGLHDYELCNVPEIFLSNHNSKEQFGVSCEYATLYGKAVSLTRTHWKQANQAMLSNRRLGVSVTGVTQFISNNGIEGTANFLDYGYDVIQATDAELSNEFSVPRSIRTTSVKPSGTVSLLAGVTPGMHFPESEFYIRRMRFSKTDQILPMLMEADYHIEPAESDPENTVVAEFYVSMEGVRSLNDVTMQEQVRLAEFMQRHWADNSVSCTVTFDPDTEGKEIANVLRYAQYNLKAISFLPKLEGGAYAQMPYEEITKEEYEEKIAGINPDVLTSDKLQQREALGDKYCDSDGCIIL